MTAHSTAVHSAEAASHPRSRLRARLVLAALSACGLAALAWASFGLPKPRLIYNPSDSVPVGWYRVDPSSNRTDSLPRPLSVGSIVLVPLPAEAATLAAQRGYLPTRVPLLKRVGAIAPQEVCIAGSSVRIDGVPSAAVLRADRLGRPLPSWRQCRRLRPGELFLLSRTNPASFDSRYFGPVSASAVIGVARPVWLDSRPRWPPIHCTQTCIASCHQACPSGGCCRVVARAVQMRSHCTSRCLRRSRPLCRRLALNAPGLRPWPRSPVGWLPAAQRHPAVIAGSASRRQRRKARQKDAAPARVESQSAHGGGAARRGFAAVLRVALSPRQDRAARVLRTMGHVAAFRGDGHERPPR